MNNWTPYNGDYEKDFQDIKLKDGTEILFTYPNAGFFNGCYQKGRYPESEVAFVRKTSKKYMDEVWEKAHQEVMMRNAARRICKEGHRYEERVENHKSIWECKRCGKTL